MTKCALCDATASVQCSGCQRHLCPSHWVKGPLSEQSYFPDGSKRPRGRAPMCIDCCPDGLRRQTVLTNYTERS